MAVSVSTHSLELISQDIANNSSVVRYLVKITTSGASHNDNNITTTYHIDGTTYTKTHKLPTKSTTTVADKTVTIVHNADGSRSVSANFSTPTGISAGTLTGSKTLTLPTIPRASEIGVADANIGSSTTITINKPPNTNFTTTISYKSPQDSEWIPIATTTQDSYAWTVPTRLYAMIPNDPTIQCQFQAKTISDGQTIGTTTTTATFRATTPPLINSFTLQDINSTTTALTGDSSKMVKYASTVRASVNSVGQNSATISYNKVNGVETSGGIVDFANATTNSYSLEVKDSRKNVATQTKTMAMIDYIPLTLNVDISRNTPTDGKVNMRFYGNYWEGNFGSQNNTLTVSYRYKEASSSTWSSWTNFQSPTITNNTYDFSVQISNITYTSVYDFEFKAVDKVQPKTMTGVRVPKGQPIYYWDDDEFGTTTKSGYTNTDYLITSDPTNSFQTTLFGNNDHYARVKSMRASSTAFTNFPSYGASLIGAVGDTHLFLSTSYNSKQAYIGAGNADKINWSCQIEWKPDTLFSGEWYVGETKTISNLSSYSYIEIFYARGNDYGQTSQKVEVGNVKCANIPIMYLENNSAIRHTAHITWNTSNNQLTFTSILDENINVSTDVVSYNVITSNNTNDKIFKILGYK